MKRKCIKCERNHNEYLSEEGKKSSKLFYNDLVVQTAKNINNQISQELEKIEEKYRFLLYMRIVNLLTQVAYKPVINYQREVIEDILKRSKSSIQTTGRK